MRAAIVGTGFIARVHEGVLRSLGVEIVAVAGRTRESAAAFDAAPAYDDVEALLDAERPDVLHVCTPNDAHARSALAALARGVHVVCEKPLAVSSEECEALVGAAEERNLVNAVCYHVRGYPLVEHMRAALTQVGSL